MRAGGDGVRPDGPQRGWDFTLIVMGQDTIGGPRAGKALV